ncbi:MAG: glycoside hydrolase family protein [Anaerolineae bacterium]
MDLRSVQLFVDDALIQETYRLGRRILPPEKRHLPVLVADRPWEGGGITLWGTVAYDAEARRFHMWYQTFGKRRDPETCQFICYATSEDGLVWEKPELGLVPYRGSVANNIVLRPAVGLDSPSVVYDPDDGERRYKMIYYQWGAGPSGLYATFSADAVHWSEPELVAPDTGDRTNAMFSRDAEGRYVVYCRAGDMMSRFNTRSVYRIESRDFRQWSPIELVLRPDLLDGPNMQFYSMTGFRYGDQYLGAIERMHTVPDVLDIELACSRDGIAWQRLNPRQTFLAREADWEGNWVHVASNPPIEFEGRLWWFYCGRHYRHGALDPHREGGVGVATSRIDGFAAIEGGPEEGRLLTKALEWPGGDLEVNADARTGLRDYFGLRGGAIRFEVRDAAGEPIPGFTLAESIPFAGDTEDYSRGQVYHRPRWSSGSTLASLAGQSIRLAFYIRAARLYSFRAAG